jgi:hypothetical protein
VVVGLLAEGGAIVPDCSAVVDTAVADAPGAAEDGLVGDVV